MAPNRDMKYTNNQFVANEIRETQTADPGLKVLSLEGRDLRDSMPVPPLEVNANKHYDLICVNDLVEKLRNGKARPLLAELFSTLNPGGRLLVSGAVECSSVETPEPFDVEELASLSAGIPDREIAGQALFHDQTGSAVFLELYKAA